MIVQKQILTVCEQADWEKGQTSAGEQILPAIVQDHRYGGVLMLGYVSATSLRATSECGELVFFSRSKKRLWRKGEKSGNVLKVKAIALDCDADTFLVSVEPVGPTCHRKTRSCFQLEDGGEPEGFPARAHLLQHLVKSIAERAQGADPNSYVLKTLEAGLDRVLKKMGEEASEFIIAAKNSERGDGQAEVLEEGADLLFHVLLSLHALGVDPTDVLEVLRGRMGQVRRDGTVPLTKSSPST